MVCSLPGPEIVRPKTTIVPVAQWKTGGLGIWRNGCRAGYLALMPADLYGSLALATKKSSELAPTASN